METAGTPLPDAVIESIKQNRVAIKGPITTPVGRGFRSVNVALRKALDLYACVRPCKSYDGVRSKYDGIDLVFVRENTEDLYAGIEFEKDTTEELALAGKIDRARPSAASTSASTPASRSSRSRWRARSGSSASPSSTRSRTTARRSRPSTRPTS